MNVESWYKREGSSENARRVVKTRGGKDARDVVKTRVKLASGVSDGVTATVQQPRPYSNRDRTATATAGLTPPQPRGRLNATPPSRDGRGPVAAPAHAESEGSVR